MSLCCDNYVTVLDTLDTTYRPLQCCHGAWTRPHSSEDPHFPKHLLSMIPPFSSVPMNVDRPHTPCSFGTRP